MKHVYINANPLTKVLGLHMTKVFYIKKQKWKITTRGRVYATSAFCSVAEEGMVKSAPAVEGGVESAIAGVKEVGVTKAAETAEGEMIDTMADAKFFAFSKKAFISERVWP
jgi:hypothetical protein